MKISRKLLALNVILIILLSASVGFYVFPHNSVAYGSYNSLGLAVSPSGNSFKLNVNQSMTFSAQVMNGTAPFSYLWFLNPTGNFTLTVNGVDTQISNASFSVSGQNLTLCYPVATEEFVSVGVSVKDANGFFGQSLVPFVVADPYSLPGYKFDASTATTSWIIQTDTLGWYRAINGSYGEALWSSTNCSNVINLARAAIVASGNSREIYFPSNIYTCTNRIIGGNGVIIHGETMGAFDNYSMGAILNYTGSDVNPFLDFRDCRYTSISSIKIINSGSSTVGLRIGGSVAASTSATKGISLTDVEVYGFSTGILGDVQGTDDSDYNGVFIGNANIGVDHLNSQSKFFGGSIFDCSIGVRIYRGTTAHPDASMEFYGTVFANFATAAIDIIGNQTIRASTFTGCWFEGPGMILRTTGAQASIYVGSVYFINCNGYTGSTIFDLRGRNINVKWDGGELYPVNNPGTIYTDGTGTTIQKVSITHLSAGAERIVFSDANNGLRGFDTNTFVMLNDFIGVNSSCTATAWAYTYQNMPCPWSANSTTTCSLFIRWTPESTNAGIRILYGANFVASIEPGSAAVRTDTIDISSNARTMMDLGGDIAIQCHGNNTIDPHVNLILFTYSY